MIFSRRGIVSHEARLDVPPKTIHEVCVITPSPTKPVFKKTCSSRDANVSLQWSELYLNFATVALFEQVEVPASQTW